MHKTESPQIELVRHHFESDRFNFESTECLEFIFVSLREEEEEEENVRLHRRTIQKQIYLIRKKNLLVDCHLYEKKERAVLIKCFHFPAISSNRISICDDHFDINRMHRLDLSTDQHFVNKKCS